MYMYAHNINCFNKNMTYTNIKTYLFAVFIFIIMSSCILYVTVVFVNVIWTYVR